MADRIVYVGNPKGFKSEFRSWSGPVGKKIRAATEIGSADARSSAPRKTGELAGGHKTNYGFHGAKADLESQIIAVPEHARYVIKGTRPHVIRPKNPGGKLVFFWKKVGRVVAFSSVNHPGTKANNYLFDSLKRTVKRMF